MRNGQRHIQDLKSARTNLHEDFDHVAGAADADADNEFYSDDSDAIEKPPYVARIATMEASRGRL